MKTIRVALFLVFLLLLACNSDPVVLEGSGTLAVSRHAIINGAPSGELAVVGLHQLTVIDGEPAIYINPFCTGTLIQPDVVLTAAHCLDASSIPRVKPMAPSDLAISVGHHPAGDDDGDLVPNVVEDGNPHPVQELQIHPDYNKRKITDDIGLVRLVNAVPGVATIPPLPPSLAIHKDFDVDNLNLHLVGFGQEFADDSNSYGVKLEGDAVLSDVLPNNQIEHTYNANDPDNDNAICFGDSGGPAIVERDEVPYVGGVASYVTAPYCENTGVHTKVDAYAGFINDFAPPPCALDVDCDDGDLCTTDTCDAGVCVNETVSCDDGDLCTTDSCDPQNGSCVYSDVDCDDGDLCTTDSCDPATGCVNEPIPDCAPSCLDAGETCQSDEDCCSGRCKGGKGNKVCR